jgi:RHS repeat-associated protein
LRAGTRENRRNIRLSRFPTETALTLTQSYGYTDGLNRLTSFQEGTISQVYDHDQYGNHWVSSNSGYVLSSLTPIASSWFDPSTNRLTGIGYDGRGNQTQINPLLPLTAAYDGEDRQKSVVSTDNSASYEYDGDGHRIRKLTCSGNSPCTDSSSGLVTTVYLYDAFGLLAAEYSTQAPASGGTEYYTQDHLGSTRLILDGTGAVKMRYDYLPFGEQLGSGVNGRSAKYSTSLFDGESMKFTSKERDAETGLDFFGARYMSSAQGRWMSPDRINLTRARLMNPSNTLNKYVYGANNPLKYIDRDGEDITIFYRPPSGASNDYGHIFLGALNQATGKVGFLDYYPAGKVNGFGEGPGAFNRGDMRERAAQLAEGQFATLTIQTTPEDAQKVLDLIRALKNGPTPDYSALFNASNCTTVCEDVLHDLGLDFGDVLPTSYWADVYYRFSADAQAHPIWTRMLGTQHAPGEEYGNPQDFGVRIPFSELLFRLYWNQQQDPQPVGCVEAHDSSGQGTGTQCN